jgi:DNA-binding response OmpR family regulator
MPDNSQSTTPSPKKILVVDDSQVIAKTIATGLSRAGYKPLVALAASDAVGLVRTEKPDLILLDINFPPEAETMTLWDGFRVIEWLRHVGDSQKIPVIIITGGPGDLDKDKERASAAGAVGFLPKPLDHEELIRMIRATLDGTKKGQS